MSATEGVPSVDVEPDVSQRLDGTVGFISAAVQAANSNALRLSLYQATHDETLLQMSVSKTPVRGGAMMDYVLVPGDEVTVRAKALEFLVNQQKDQRCLKATTNGDHAHIHRSNGSTEPTDPDRSTVTYADAVQLMKAFTGEDLDEANLQLGYEELAFQPFPRGVRWSQGAKPSVDRLNNYHVAVIGAGINGISTAVHLKRLGIPFTVIDRQADVGGTWYNNTYPGEYAIVVLHKGIINSGRRSSC